MIRAIFCVGLAIYSLYALFEAEGLIVGIIIIIGLFLFIK